MTHNPSKSQDFAPNKGASNLKLAFPAARIRTIMKSSPDVTNISQECVLTVAKATVRCALLFL